MRSTRGCAKCKGHIFKEKFRKGYVNFFQNSGKSYNIWKKFRTGSVILMTQMTNQKNKTELIDYFNLVWTKNPQYFRKGLENGSHFSQNSPQNRILETSTRHINSEKGSHFFVNNSRKGR